MDYTFIALAVVAVLIAGVSKGGFGAGAAFVATPVLALAVGPVAAAAILLPLLVVMDWVGLRAYWRQWDLKAVLPILIGSVPGVFIGWLFFGQLSVDVLSILLGALCLALISYHVLSNLLIKQAKSKPSFGRGSAWGGLAGFMSFVIHAGGPPVTVYLAPLNLEKRAFQASSVLVFAVVNAIKLPPYFALGLFDPSNLLVTAWLLPLAPVAMWIGVWAHDKISERWFYRIIYALAAVASAKLLYDGVIGLI